MSRISRMKANDICSYPKQRKTTKSPTSRNAYKMLYLSLFLLFLLANLVKLSESITQSSSNQIKTKNRAEGISSSFLVCSRL